MAHFLNSGTLRYGKKELFLAFGAISFLIYTYLSLSWSFRSPVRPLPPSPPPPRLPFHHPFLSRPSFTSYAINTSNCKIPDFEPWPNASMSNSSMIRWLNTSLCNLPGEREPRCSEREDVRDWFYSDGSHLIVNHTAIRGDGYKWNSIGCCYHVIKRVEQTLEDYNKEADNVVRLTNRCYKLPNSSRKIPIRHDFIRVSCMSSYLLLPDIVYRGFFAFAKTDPRAKEKISEWEAVPQRERPPNVILLGIDTNSRLNSRRQLPKTLKLLRSMGAVEMFGYTKVGENTIPNAIGFLTGVSEEELKPYCLRRDKDAQDGCPYIFKDFDRMGYLTATAEDHGSSISTFNYEKTGFVHKPTDFYYRTFAIGTAHQPSPDGYENCIGHRRVDQVQLDYVSDILQLASEGAPVFVHSWSSIWSHSCLHHVGYFDEPIENFLRKNVEKSTNTILFFMSDHGERAGHVRETMMGWYEDKLPTMWIYMSPDLSERFPQWDRAIQANSRRLSSSFDLYHTMKQILAAFNNKKQLTFDESYGDRKVPKRRGQTLLEPLPESRTCVEAGIPESYCACSEPQIVDVNGENPRLKIKLNQMASLALKFLRKILPPPCSTPVLKKIVSAKYLNLVGKASGPSKLYIVSFYTDPGDFLFEVTVTVIAKTRKGREKYSIKSTNDILRMNKMERKVDCLRDPVLERYCYCP